jgi:hypothetical protein
LGDALTVRLSEVSENLIVQEILGRKNGSPEGLYSIEKGMPDLEPERSDYKEGDTSISHVKDSV